MRSWLAVFCKFGPLLLALCAILPPSALALTASQVYEQVKDSVVVVKAYDQKGKPVGLGSGVMLPSGDVITNYHVVKAGVRYTVGRGKQGVPATLEAGDPDKDLCLLTAPGLVAKPARLGRAARLKVGEPVYAVGAPQGLELSLSEGIVSQLRGGPPPLIQTTVAISGGSSGGGLFNAEGELVGITTFYLKDSQSLNFAVPVEWIAEVAMGKILERPRPTFQPPKESLDPLGIGRHWLIEWKSQYYYQGTLKIQEELEKNQYLTKITIRYSNEKNIQRTVSFDGLLTINGNNVVIHCSNPTASWWVTDDFYLKLRNDIMEGYSVDKAGRRGYARFKLAEDFTSP
jgi:hypothetical protein